MSVGNGRSDEGAACFQVEIQLTNLSLPPQLLLIIPGNHSLLLRQSRSSDLSDKICFLGAFGQVISPIDPVGTAEKCLPPVPS